MDEKVKPKSKGRGTLLFEMLKQSASIEERFQAAISDSLETPNISSTEPSRSSEENSLPQLPSLSGQSRARGRGQLIAALQSISSNESESRSSSLTKSYGRGSLIDFTNLPSSEPWTSGQAMFVKKDDSTGILERLSDLSVYDNKSDIPSSEDTRSICRQGKSGTKIEIFTNYIDLKLDPSKGLFQYHVKFTPDIDSGLLRRKLLNQHSTSLGRTKTFDGMTLFLPIKLPQEVTCYHSTHPMDGSQVILTITYKKQQSMSENIQFFNILFNRIMRALGLIRIGRQNFNPEQPHIIQQHRLEVWPGYVTAVNEYEGGLKLCLDAKHRVMRTETIRDLMNDIYKTESNPKDVIMKEIIGASVLTRYNNKTYRIDDIAWDKTPKYVFSRDNEPISIIDYYKIQWKMEIKDYNQPLLVHRGTFRTQTGEKQERMILLVPELSYVAGLTESVRSNHKIMKDLHVITKMSPNHRRNVIKNFVKAIQANELTRELLSEWGLHISDDIIRISGRCLEPELIRFGNNRTYQSFEKPADWNAAVVKNPVLRTPNLTKWNILYCIKNETYVKEFVNMLLKIAGAIGMRINQPQCIALRDDRIQTYAREIENSIEQKIQLIAIVFPTNRTDRYSAVKKLCCVQAAVASQVIIARTISKFAKLKAVTEKIALQMNCKLGGALWTINLPLKNCMICGIDVYHAGIKGGERRSVAGFTASLDMQLSKWHNKICMQGSKQELMDMLQLCLTSAINAYHKHNDYYPERIIIYRDGVGDGDFHYVEQYEVKQLLETFNRIIPNYKPQLSVIIVQKRINTRLFVQNKDGLDNPMAGTIVDSYITRRNYYDFFLVPQNVRQEVTVGYWSRDSSENFEKVYIAEKSYQRLCKKNNDRRLLPSILFVKQCTWGVSAYLISDT